jgi:LPS-assembly protein
MLRFSSILMVCVALDWLGAAASARAQTPIGGCKLSTALYIEVNRLPEDHYVLDGTEDVPVQIDCDDVQFFADHMELFQKEGRVTAQGNVVYISGGNKIWAERMEFNTKTRTGTFFVANGIATLREAVQPNIFGAQEPDAWFWGDELQKIGPKKYRIIRGGFTTCVQPAPRWDMRSGSITLNLDDYAILKNAVFRVKNVPLMFLPIFYYPIQEDDRATGFLMPIYGSTTTQGQSITNQFFWAISRSQDATVEHDWFSKTGQRIGGEYRYIRGPGAQGSTQMSLLNEHPTTYAQPNGSVVNYDGRRSYSVVGGMTQPLPLNLRARANANYTSSIVSRQRYQQDISQSTNRSRSFGGNLSGSWGGYSISVTADKSDYFNNETTFQTTGSLPRVNFSRGERAVGHTPLYFGLNSEYVTLARSTSENDVEISNSGLTRLDFNPTLRIPFNRWQFLTVNSVVSWRGTYWTESIDPEIARVNPSKAQVPVGIGRRYMDFQARITGPVFNRIWTPNSGYAEKLKHVIEPTLTIQRTTSIDNREKIVFLDGTDYVVGGVTRVNYGVSNRLYAKKGTSREILSATLSQSYYTVATAAQFDTSSHSQLGTQRPSNFGSVNLYVRGAPTARVQGDFRTEWDPTAHAFKTFAANGGVAAGEWLQSSFGWSQSKFSPNLPPFNLVTTTNYLNASATLRRPGNRIGGAYSFYYDLKNSTFQQQRFTAYYNAQCCGIGIEYQTYNFAGSFAAFGVPQDRRFNLSFTLAGVGTFSNLFGAFGGQQGR